jgi:putative FmdB family regulatory protein
MPTYEYRCPNGHEFDLFQSMSDEPGALCPECGESAERLMSGGAGLIFKGEGFYITDYRSDAYKKAASSDKEASSSEKTSGGDSAEKSGGGKSSSDGSGGSSDGGSSKSKGGSSGSSGGSKTSQSAKPSSSDS